MKLIVFTRYSRLGASSRVRSYQYLPFFADKGIATSVNVLFDDDYLGDLYSGRGKPVIKIIKAYLKRFVFLLNLKQFDLVWIEKELFPFCPAWAEQALKLSGVKYLVDYDDAVFHNYDRHPNLWIRYILKNKIDRVMASAYQVMVGNAYLALRARKAGAQRVAIVPSVVDTERYEVKKSFASDTFCIGWIGSPATQKYLDIVCCAIRSLNTDRPVKLMLIGANDLDCKDLDIVYHTWSEASERQLIKQFDVGIMPLDDGLWEQGKCGYKLLQYMACGVPVVASPVGINRSIVEHGVNGLLAGNVSEWIEALEKLISRPDRLRRMGKKGHEKVHQVYSLRKENPRVQELVLSCR